MTSDPRPYRGRFAPSPTGDLHFGSLVAAVASYLEARRAGGEWLVRVEDIDPPRVIRGSARRILSDLQRLGMQPHGEVLYQSTRTQAFEDVIERLVDEGHAYWCGCSRADLPASGVYPGTCRDGMAGGRRRRSVRLRTDGARVRFHDAVQGEVRENLEETVGDFVIRRADGYPAYQLAVVVDDAFQDITQVVRGADLLDSTPRQVWLQKTLGLATPGYAHVPVATDPSGAKLSKRLNSDPVARHPPAAAVQAALRFLGHQPPESASLGDTWAWAIDHWHLENIPRNYGTVRNGQPLQGVE